MLGVFFEHVFIFDRALAKIRIRLYMHAYILIGKKLQ